MIITEELLNKLTICQQGIRRGVIAAQMNGGYWGNSVAESIEILNKLNLPGVALWVEQNIGKLIETTGEGIYSNEYRVQDPVTGEYAKFFDLTSAQKQIEDNKQKFIQQYSDTFVVNHIIYDEQGNATWIPIDINSTNETENFNVFDPNNGINTVCATLDEAKVLQKQIHKTFIDTNIFKFVIEQKISHPDGETGWTDTLSQQ